MMIKMMIAEFGAAVGKGGDKFSRAAAVHARHCMDGKRMLEN